MSNRALILTSRPSGLAGPENFTVEERPLPEPGDGQFRVRIRMISLDPAMRGWMAEGRSYIEPVALGEVMRGFAAGTVEASRHPDYPDGSHVVGLFGVQHYALSDGTGVWPANLLQAPLERWLGGLGMPGLTAYFGVLKIGHPHPGETVVVSAAAGGVGQAASQLARLQGARVVGIAGGSEKCRFLTEELGLDAAVDHRRDDFAEALAAACPGGIDVYYENVGGPLGEACLQLMRPFGRVPLCGLIHYYNSPGEAVGLSPRALRSVLVNRLTVRGFVFFDFRDDFAEAASALGHWHVEGRLHFREDIRQGRLEDFPRVLNELYDGGNFGKLVLSLED